MTPGLHRDIPESSYHADTDSLSVSGAKLILKAPALYRYRRDHPEHKDVFDYGSAAHRLVLGAGPDLAVIDADSWRTKDAQAQRDQARSEGRIPILASDHRQVMEMADALTHHQAAMRLLSEGTPEVSAYAEDEDTGVMRRCRFDWLTNTGVLVDYKTTITADPTAWAGRYGVLQKWGYAQQAAWYLDVARTLGHPADVFAFVAQEKTAPWLVSVVYVDDDQLYEARERNAEALRIFAECTATGHWPGYLPDDSAARLRIDQPTYIEETVL